MCLQKYDKFVKPPNFSPNKTVFEQIGKDLNKLERGETVLNTAEKQKNKREKLFGE